MGIFDGIASAISSVYSGVSRAVSSAASAVSSAAGSAARAVSSFVAPSLAAASSAVSSAIQGIPSTLSGAAAFVAPSVSSLVKVAQVAQQNAAALAPLMEEKAASAAALAAGQTKAYADAVAANVYRVNNGLAPIDLTPFTREYQEKARAAAAAATKAVQEQAAAAQKEAARIAALPESWAKTAITTFTPPKVTIPDAAKVAAEIKAASEAALNTAQKTAGAAINALPQVQAVKGIAAAADVAGKALSAAPTVIGSIAAVPAAAGAAAVNAVSPQNAPAIAALSANIPTFTTSGASPLVSSTGSINVPMFSTSPGSFVAPSPSNGNFIDQIIGTRDNSYTLGGETFAKGWESNDAGTAALGAGLYGATTAVDVWLPLDALNVGNKIATGRLNEISGEEWIYGGIDVGLMALGSVTAGTGYVAGKAAMKGAKVALAGTKAAKVGKEITKAAEAAAPVGLAALGIAAGGNKNMIKLGKIISPVVKSTGNAAQIAAKNAAAVKKAAAAQQAAAKAAAARASQAAAAAKKAAAQQAAAATAAAKKAAAVRAATVTAAAKKAATTKAAAKVSTLKAAASETSTFKAPSAIKAVEATETAPKTIKTLESSEAAIKAESAAVEESGILAKASKSNLKTIAGAALGAGMVGIGLGSYLGGGSQPVTDPTIDPTTPTVDPYASGTEIPDYSVPTEYLDPLTGEVDPAYYDMLNDQLDQIDAAEASGQISSEQADTLRDQVTEQIDQSGGYFDAAFGEGTPYEAIENAAQDATRAIPGDPLEWFRQNGLAAPAMGGAIILVVFVVWWLYKRLTKGKAGTSRRHRSPRANAPGSGKQVVVM